MVIVDVTSDTHLFLRVGIRESSQQGERGECFHEVAGLFVLITIRAGARVGDGNPRYLQMTEWPQSTFRVIPVGGEARVQLVEIHHVEEVANMTTKRLTG